MKHGLDVYDFPIMHSHYTLHARNM